MSRPAWLGTDGNLAFTDSIAATAWATANPSLVYDGLLATIGGSAYIWTSGAWAAVGGGSTQSFETYAALAATDPTFGKLALLKRFCGNGYFYMRADGTEWGICPGEYCIRDLGPGGAGYALTAANTNITVMQTYTIPAGFVKNFAAFLLSMSGVNDGVYVSGNDYYRARVAGNQVTQGFGIGLNVFGGAASSIQRIGTKSAMGLNNAYGPNNAPMNTTNLSEEFVVDITLQAGAITNKLKALHFSMQRAFA